MKRNSKNQNFLNFIPLTSFNWYVSEETKKVIIQRPKFDNPLLKKYIVPFFKKPFFEVKLDEFGSFVWQKIDGQKTIYEIANELKNQYGQKVDPVYDRVSRFIKHLRQQRMVDYKKKNDIV
ncbi:PqqD family protein [Calditrichota bacterium]